MFASGLQACRAAMPLETVAAGGIGDD